MCCASIYLSAVFYAENIFFTVFSALKMQPLKSNTLQGLDIGPKSVDQFKAALKDAKSVIWNGPMGVFEMKPFANGTNAIAQTLADLTSQASLKLFFLSLPNYLELPFGKETHIFNLYRWVQLEFNGKA